LKPYKEIFMVMSKSAEPLPKQSWQEIETRATAAFLAVAVGDALGATTEFMTPHEIKFKYGVHKKIIGGGWLHLDPGQVTDDTQMSLYMARAIQASGGWNIEAVADHFVQWMKSRPVDIGATCARGIRTYLHKGITQMPYNEWDAGNGAVMRMVPVALYTLGSEELLIEHALEQARLTHHHPLSDAACVTIGRMVQQAVLGASLEQLRDLTEELIVRYPKFAFQRYSGHSSAYVVDTIQTVFHYLFNTSNFKECLIGVVNQGGDADTTGAIAGMVAGPLYGRDTFPKIWTRRLAKSLRKEIETLALWLVGHSPLANHQR
jgi:ADP-ribosyl-[dinitrogen reductase] hydrolase